MFRKRIRLLTITILLLGLMTAAGCATPAAEPSSEPEASLRVALVMPGSIADEGYNAAAYAGLQAVEETYGAEIAFSEMVPLAEYEETFREYAREGYDIVIGHGFQFGDPVEKVAPEFPDTYFLVVNGAAAGPNYASLAPQVQEASYVAGHIAARMSESGKIGAIGGFALPDVVCWLEAYRFGALDADPDIDVTIAYIDSFDDIALGKEATLAQISAGADCIIHIADAAGIGVIQACQQEGVWAIGFAFDQNSLAPETVITSAMVDYGKMVVDAVGDIKDGTFEFGVIHPYGLASGAVPLADYYGLVPEDIAAEAQDIQQKIIDGEIEVPIVYEPTE